MSLALHVNKQEKIDGKAHNLPKNHHLTNNIKKDVLVVT